MTPFCFEHVFRAPSPGVVFEAYFDAAHQIEQDRCVELAERQTLELVDRGDELRRVCKVVPRRQLPALIKPFVPGSLHYVETVSWRRSAAEIAIEIRPSMLGGRVRISATYRLAAISPDEVHRRYAGHVSVDVALIAARIERGIVDELSHSLPRAATCTQLWLDRRFPPSVAARA